MVFDESKFIVKLSNPTVDDLNNFLDEVLQREWNYIEIWYAGHANKDGFVLNKNETFKVTNFAEFKNWNGEVYLSCCESKTLSKKMGSDTFRVLPVLNEERTSLGTYMFEKLLRKDMSGFAAEFVKLINQNSGLPSLGEIESGFDDGLYFFECGNYEQAFKHYSEAITNIFVELGGKDQPNEIEELKKQWVENYTNFPHCENGNCTLCPVPRGTNCEDFKKFLDENFQYLEKLDPNVVLVFKGSSISGFSWKPKKIVITDFGIETKVIMTCFCCLTVLQRISWRPKFSSKF